MWIDLLRCCAGSNPTAPQIKQKNMKAYYINTTIKKDFTRTFGESLQMLDENQESYVPETAEIDLKLESVDIPAHLIEKFKESFKNKTSPFQEDDILTFLKEN
jgi:hypothetical protein